MRPDSMSVCPDPGGWHVRCQILGCAGPPSSGLARRYPMRHNYPMRNLRGTYVHRGDASRRHARAKRAALFLSFCGALGMAWDARTGPREASAEPVVFARGADFQKMRNELDAA